MEAYSQNSHIGENERRQFNEGYSENGEKSKTTLITFLHNLWQKVEYKQAQAIEQLKQVLIHYDFSEQQMKNPQYKVKDIAGKEMQGRNELVEQNNKSENQTVREDKFHDEEIPTKKLYQNDDQKQQPKPQQVHNQKHSHYDQINQRNYYTHNHHNYRKATTENDEESKQKIIDIEEFKKFVTQKTSKKIYHIQLPNPQTKPQLSPKMEKKNKGKEKNPSKVYKIDGTQTRKHSLRKSEEAQLQIIANIEFLKNIKGKHDNEGNLKEWRHPKLISRNSVSEYKEARRKHLQSLGFTNSSQNLQSSKIDSTLLLSPSRSHMLPQINSRRKGQILKPAAFSVYSLQKNNQIFKNKLIE